MFLNMLCSLGSVAVVHVWMLKRLLIIEMSRNGMAEEDMKKDSKREIGRDHRTLPLNLL